MKILLIEDERPAALRLEKMLETHCPQGKLLDVIDSVAAAVRWLRNFPAPDLIFMDIQLADGLSFDIFSQVEVASPVIFTTAFDQYTLQAFKVNSVDYLLKPIDPVELCGALEKHARFFKKQEVYDSAAIRKMLADLAAGQAYKERFLVKTGDHLNYVSVSDIAWFFSEDGVVFAQCFSGKKHILEYSLDQLDPLLDPRKFFRINRKVLVNLESIQKISSWFNSRLKLELRPVCPLDLVVSRERVGDFKKWLDR